MSISLNAKRVIFFAFLLLILIGLLLSVGLARYLVRPFDMKGPDQTFLVPQGATLRDVAGRLEKDRIISSKTLLIWSIRILRIGGDIKAGEYCLSSRMSPLEILDILKKGKVIPHEVTIPEGFSLRQIAMTLEREGLVEKERFLRLITDPALPAKYGLPGPTLEGYLFPDTYRFSRAQSPESMVDTMVKRFLKIISSFEDRIAASGMTLGQIVTLASLIEKETGKPEERALIASVFLNRMERGMRLESDPTVIYGISDFNGNLTKEDLKRPGPYNTYVIHGLPPAPIASPGKEAIHAVLNPARTDYLYFVSRNDGSHHFSKTLEEHNKAVERYQRKGAARKEEAS